mmetsp:Transcript_39614/g.55185  ORF Transcript_39614/g.55185 Transcript_39614/m.55185 type:complete len:1010 (+) Transcript_39614:27-3056(+)|eukprot:CAMPEP_0201478900 /NCGR_PEP_ID=MMETSP0151_2-20130828/3659_1 /ASSEMBLY_ACC=CAM_ASM_000257 /TAXON_ID=200890 /ORGANISM="Paramoeba atlantica, Strain 621/1 / CCAP 1560/9" /LENGTH=1009 /DNA_ID=CAMNT_0047860157 /DNA_START=44 /DNA_END=3073 /DNA_ORIENTATION=+
MAEEVLGEGGGRVLRSASKLTKPNKEEEMADGNHQSQQERRRTRQNLSREVVEILEAQYQICPYVSQENCKQLLAQKTGLPAQKIVKWFDNRRSKDRKRKRQIQSNDLLSHSHLAKKSPQPLPRDTLSSEQYGQPQKGHASYYSLSVPPSTTRKMMSSGPMEMVNSAAVAARWPTSPAQTKRGGAQGDMKASLATLMSVAESPAQQQQNSQQQAALGGFPSLGSVSDGSRKMDSEIQDFSAYGLMSNATDPTRNGFWGNQKDQQQTVTQRFHQTLLEKLAESRADERGIGGNSQQFLVPTERPLQSLGEVHQNERDWAENAYSRKGKGVGNDTLGKGEKSPVLFQPFWSQLQQQSEGDTDDFRAIFRVYFTGRKRGSFLSSPISDLDSQHLHLCINHASKALECLAERLVHQIRHVIQSMSALDVIEMFKNAQYKDPKRTLHFLTNNREGAEALGFHPSVLSKISRLLPMLSTMLESQYSFPEQKYAFEQLLKWVWAYWSKARKYGWSTPKVRLQQSKENRQRLSSSQDSGDFLPAALPSPRSSWGSELEGGRVIKNETGGTPSVTNGSGMTSATWSSLETPSQMFATPNYPFMSPIPPFVSPGFGAPFESPYALFGEKGKLHSGKESHNSQSCETTSSSLGPPLPAPQCRPDKNSPNVGNVQLLGSLPPGNSPSQSTSRLFNTSSSSNVMTENPKKASPLSSIGVLSSLTEVASASSPRSGTHQSSSLFSSVSGTSSTSNSSAIGENSERQRVKTEQNEGKNDPKKVEKMFMSPIFVAPSPRTLFGGLDSPFPSLASPMGASPMTSAKSPSSRKQKTPTQSIKKSLGEKTGAILQKDLGKFSSPSFVQTSSNTPSAIATKNESGPPALTLPDSVIPEEKGDKEGGTTGGGETKSLQTLFEGSPPNLSPNSSQLSLPSLSSALSSRFEKVVGGEKEAELLVLFLTRPHRDVCGQVLYDLLDAWLKGQDSLKDCLSSLPCDVKITPENNQLVYHNGEGEEIMLHEEQFNP